jgi:hypothetical protein
MNVGELKKKLEEFPDDMQVVVEQYSDYNHAENVSVIKGAEQQTYIMQVYDHTDKKYKANEKEYLLISY